MGLGGTEGILTEALYNSIKTKIQQEIKFVGNSRLLHLLCEGIAAAMVPHIIHTLQTSPGQAVTTNPGQSVVSTVPLISGTILVPILLPIGTVVGTVSTSGTGTTSSLGSTT